MEAIGLYRKDAGEALNDIGHLWDEKARLTIERLVREAVELGVSLRDFENVIRTQTSLIIATELLRKGVAASKAKRTLNAAKKG